MIKKKPRRGKGDEDDDDNGFGVWGGYMAAKKAKLEDQFLLCTKKEDEHISEIFKGIAIFVNGYTVPTADELKRIMMLHGGIYHHYESHKTTHIIASNLPDTKVKQLKTLNVVKPAWIVESVAAGTLLDYRKYLLYSNQTKSQPRLNFEPLQTSSLDGSKDTTPSKEKGSNEQTPSSGPRTNNGNPTSSNDQLNIQITNLCNKNGDKFESACSDLSVCSNMRKTNALVTSSEMSNEGSEQVKTNGCSSSVKHKSHESIKRTAREPQFLAEFYGNSRLHHLSTMGATFKEYVASLRAKSVGNFPGLKRLIEWKKANKDVDFIKDNDILDDFMEDTLLDDKNKKNMQGLKTIMHIDMDCFFVSVGLRNRPDLVHLPVAVTHAKGNSSHAREGSDRQFEREFYQERFQNRMKQKQGKSNQDDKIQRKSRLDDVGENESLSEIASCNYEARKAGIKNGMFFGAAIKLCPNLKTIPYDFEGYKEVSYKLYDIVASYTLDIEAVSCDEMYVDCTTILSKANVSVMDFATFLRGEIKEVTGCTASAGFGSNPLQARLATKQAKPNGQFQLTPSTVEAFMQSIRVEDLPGVGYSLAYRLHADGITTCHDLQRMSLASLQKKFGVKTGEALHRHARGEDNRVLDVCHQRKSVSAEVNYGIRFTCQEEAEVFLKQLAEEVVTRMQQSKVKGRQVTLKLMVRAKDAPMETAKFMGHGACNNISRSTTLGIPTNDANIIFREAVALERQLKIVPSDLRGVGIQISRLVNLHTSSPKSTLLTNFLCQNKEIDRKHEEKIQEKIEMKYCKNVELPVVSSELEQKNDFEPAKLDSDRYMPSKNEKRSLSNFKEHSVENICKESRKNTESEYIKSSHERASCDSWSKKDTIPILNAHVEVPLLTFAQVRKLIRDWVASESNPKNCDITIFSNYIQRMVQGHHLEDVDYIFSMLHRLLTNRGKVWKQAYKSMVKNTQAIMQVVYGADLKLREFN